MYPQSLSQAPFFPIWQELPALDGGVDPFDFRQRMSAYRLLVDSTNPRQAFGAENQLNPYWAYMFQLYWQWRSGRLHLERTPQERIDPDSIWGYSNYYLSLLPLVAATQVGLAPAVQFLPPDPASAVEYISMGARPGEYQVPAVFQGALEAWKKVFAFIARLEPGGDLEAVQFLLWHAHGASLVACEPGVARLSGPYSRMERDFLAGWMRMVDFLAAAAWQTDLPYMLANGLDVLPQRMLTDQDQPGQIPDMVRAVNDNIEDIFGLVRQSKWRFAVNLWMWERAMRTRAARQEVLPMLAAVFAPSPANAADRRKLLRYIIAP